MAKQSPSVFLEEWLQSSSGVNDFSPSGPTLSAQAIIQAWADLRDLLQRQTFHPRHLEALKTLISSQVSLYVAEPQAKLVVAILSSDHVSLPPESYAFFLRLLYVWVRKSSRHSPLLVTSVVDLLLHLFSRKFDSTRSSSFLSEEILLLGSLSFSFNASEKSKTSCLELLYKVLEEDYVMIGSSDSHMHSVLAGIGYALSSSVQAYYIEILDFLFGMWNKKDGPSANVSQGLMILHLIEWVLSNNINAHASDKINLLRMEAFQSRKPAYATFAVLMAAAGVLRCLGRWGSTKFMELRTSAEEVIGIVGNELISRTHCLKSYEIQSRESFLLQCISLALARVGSVTFRAPLFLCLTSALLIEIFPLQRIYDQIIEHTEGGLFELGLNKHLETIIFKEAGVVTRVLCNFYASADEENQHAAETMIWDFCRHIYIRHRQAALVLQGHKGMLLTDLEKIAESAFLMVVVFALTVTKHRLNHRIAQEIQQQLSVKILISFSCMEYFRRMRLPEYLDTIRAVIISIQENESACISFVESMPSYDDLTRNNGRPTLQKTEYVWFTDEVQTARILFYLRVLPTCIERLSATAFRKIVAPIMFLYLGHPNAKVARASHSVFVAFLSSGKDQEDKDRVQLKEQLVFYYMQRALELYPGLTPYEGLASGVAALVRQLPAGCPPIFYCIHSLVEKVKTLCSLVNSKEADLWKSWDGDLEPPKKLLELLLRLLYLVDIQVLPALMKQLAEFIVQLPPGGHDMVLNELYQQIAESDDVTRKPTLVSWVQSLSYLHSLSSLSLNSVSSRL
ncbi:hypothetical protein LIER_06696 [Lithospermum erythrorhizon]|uniref:Uncharacterized protein n=1 Tax=Lithospermum erythrorhizon TaxID=34254 RepID=A0AAV3P9S5_LITER